MYSKILLLYTGGTIGMEVDPFTNSLTPLDFKHLENHIPELAKFDLSISALSFDQPIDSSNINPSHWKRIVSTIAEHYENFDGFVVLHGSDTMAYTAAALSFMIDGLNKPIILTGSQLPIGQIRTDGKENLITAIEIAAARNEKNEPMVPEVALFFEDELYRGNRTHKYSTENFEAFGSPNYPVLAKAGVSIKYKAHNIHQPLELPFSTNLEMGDNLVVVQLYPGISSRTLEATFDQEDLKVIILRTYGSGNAPTDDWFLALIEAQMEKGVVIFNVTQCDTGFVNQGKYQTSRKLKELGVVGGADIVIEAAIAKTMHLIGKGLSGEELKFALGRSLKGEMSI